MTRGVCPRGLCDHIASTSGIPGHSTASTTLNIYAAAVVEAQERVVAAVGDVLVKTQSQLAEKADAQAG